MIKFDLERALAGDKVITRNGDEVTQLIHFDVEDEYPINAVVNGSIESWSESGQYYIDRNTPEDDDLVMAPKKLSGFVNIYSYGAILYATKESTDIDGDHERVACIDLSQFEEGHGL